MVPGTDDRAWFAILKSEGVGGCGEPYLYSMDGATVTNRGEVGAACGWTTHAPPSITIDTDGTVYVAAAKADGPMWIFRRDPSGTLTNEGSLGSTSTWSKFAGATIQRQPDGTWLNQGSLGIGDWSEQAQPGLTVDNDGDVTVAIVEAGHGSGAAVHSYRRCATCVEWHYVGQVGAESGWSTTGTLAIAAAPNDRVGLNAAPEAGAGTPHQPSPSPQGGTVFLTAVKTDGTMWAFKRNATTGDRSNHGQIGANGWTGKTP